MGDEVGVCEIGGEELVNWSDSAKMYKILTVCTAVLVQNKAKRHTDSLESTSIASNSMIPARSTPTGRVTCHATEDLPAVSSRHSA